MGCSLISGSIEALKDGESQTATDIRSELQVQSETNSQIDAVPLIYTTFSNDEFAIDYPKGWKPIEMDEPSHSLIKLTLRNEQSKNAFADNINVAVEPNDKKTPLLRKGVSFQALWALQDSNL